MSLDCLRAGDLLLKSRSNTANASYIMNHKLYTTDSKAIGQI
jgi:hypothetical protein